MWNRLDELQQALLAAVEEHRILCLAATPDRGALSASRWRVAQAGRVRMDHLVGYVFPTIEGNHDAAALDRFAALRDGTAPYQRQVSAYVARWPTSAILAEWTSYRLEAQALRRSVLSRIAEEAEVIRPLLAQMRGSPVEAVGR